MGAAPKVHEDIRWPLDMTVHYYIIVDTDEEDGPRDAKQERLWGPRSLHQRKVEAFMAFHERFIADNSTAFGPPTCGQPSRWAAVSPMNMYAGLGSPPIRRESTPARVVVVVGHELGEQQWAAAEAPAIDTAPPSPRVEVPALGNAPFLREEGEERRRAHTMRNRRKANAVAAHLRTNWPSAPIVLLPTACAAADAPMRPWLSGAAEKGEDAGTCRGGSSRNPSPPGQAERQLGEEVEARHAHDDSTSCIAKPTNSVERTSCGTEQANSVDRALLRAVAARLEGERKACLSFAARRSLIAVVADAAAPGGDFFGAAEAAAPQCRILVNFDMPLTAEAYERRVRRFLLPARESSSFEYDEGSPRPQAGIVVNFIGRHKVDGAASSSSACAFADRGARLSAGQASPAFESLFSEQQCGCGRAEYWLKTLYAAERVPDRLDELIYGDKYRYTLPYLFGNYC